MDCYNEGILSREELDGIDLKWGNPHAIAAITEKIVKGEGCGKILMNGSREAAKKWNKGFDQLVLSSGMEEAQHDARLTPTMARTYQYDPTPGRHVKGGLGMGYIQMPPEMRYNTFSTGFADLLGTAKQEVINCSGFCMFGSGFFLAPGVDYQYINAVTGFNYTPRDFFALGLRIFHLRHSFNIREGLRRKDFTVTDRLLGKPPLKEGPLAGITVDNEKLAENFFNAIGWNQEGLPNKDMLSMLGGLDNIINDIYPSQMNTV
jgi:aldehyde:ferredoxin oxidoreductase